MPNVNPGTGAGTGSGPNANPDKFPQWGVDQQFDIIEAKNASDKEADAAKGYLVWFSSAGDAKNWISNQKNSFLSGNWDPLSGIAGALTAFYHAVTDGKLWRSVGWLLLGIALMLTGVLLWIGPSAARRGPLGVLGDFGRQLG